MSVKDKLKTTIGAASPLFGRKSAATAAAEPAASISSPSGFKHASHVGADLTWSGSGGSVEAFDFQRLLGTGAFGEVWYAKHLATEQVFAMKELPVLDLKAVEQEVDILRRCRHDNIVSYYGTVDDPHRERVFILMEYCEMGVRDLIEKVAPERVLSEDETLAVIKQTLLGLQYLHKQSVIHRDIKGSNLLINSKGVVKVADFGVSALGKVADTTVGSPYWMAPEVVEAQTYTGSCDIWALGVVVIELMEGRPPRHEYSPMVVLRLVVVKEPPELAPDTVCSAKSRHFVSRCLVKDPASRASIKELLEHAWISSANGDRATGALVARVAEVQAATADAEAARLVAALKKTSLEVGASPEIKVRPTRPPPMPPKAAAASATTSSAAAVDPDDALLAAALMPSDTMKIRHGSSMVISDDGLVYSNLATMVQSRLDASSPATGSADMQLALTAAEGGATTAGQRTSQQLEHDRQQLHALKTQLLQQSMELEILRERMQHKPSPKPSNPIAQLSGSLMRLSSQGRLGHKPDPSSPHRDATRPVVKEQLPPPAEWKAILAQFDKLVHGLSATVYVRLVVLAIFKECRLRLEQQPGESTVRLIITDASSALISDSILEADTVITEADEATDRKWWKVKITSPASTCVVYFGSEDEKLAFVADLKKVVRILRMKLSAERPSKKNNAHMRVCSQRRCAAAFQQSRRCLASSATSATSATSAPLAQGERLVYATRSAYNPAIRVIDDAVTGSRFLRFQTSENQSCISLSRPRDLQLAYVRGLASALEAFVPLAGSRVCMVGLGAGTLANWLQSTHEPALIECVEIDAEVAAVAQRYFFLRSGPNLKIRVQDGREFLRAAPAATFDCVVLDAFGGKGDESIATSPRLLSVEFLHELKLALKKHGVALANVWSQAVNPLYDDTIASYLDVFSHVRVLTVPHSGNRIVVASVADLEEQPSLSEETQRIMRTSLEDATTIGTPIKD